MKAGITTPDAKAVKHTCDNLAYDLEFFVYRMSMVNAKYKYHKRHIEAMDAFGMFVMITTEFVEDPNYIKTALTMIQEYHALISN